ncbi:hypothetical protein [Stenotrophomonas sp. TWI819]|uniref:hypothetical protein n=1 Tax=Stenotrophomonas sp. TWI819 TaxID=3136800 RepID=UPI00320BA7BA
MSRSILGQLSPSNKLADSSIRRALRATRNAAIRVSTLGLRFNRSTRRFVVIARRVANILTAQIGAGEGTSLSTTQASKAMTATSGSAAPNDESKFGMHKTKKKRRIPLTLGLGGERS